MSRPFRVRALALLALFAAAGCQDYNFNPVGKCLIQPGNTRERLSDVSTADVLFIVDESGSMQGEQQKLAANFDAFITRLNGTNQRRVDNGLQPIDFHIAVTTTSIFFNYGRGETCRNDCAGAVGQNVCCQTTNAPLRQPRSCAAGPGVCAAGTECRTDCNGLKGDPYCCIPTTLVPPVSDVVACTTLGARCGTMQQHYDFQGCDPGEEGIAVRDWPYARGDFVSWTDAVGGTANPRVLHFDKQLYQAGGGGVNRQSFTQAQLQQFFVGGGAVNGNVIVGTCGSGEEQALEAARLAVQKAIDGQQHDTYSIAGAQTWTPATRTAGSAAEWPHENAKLVLVFVGDEDDCSSPVDASDGVVWLPGEDTCVDSSQGELGKQYRVTEIVDYFFGLGRPLGAAFIFPAAQTQCSGAECTVGGLCCATDCPGTIGVCTNNAVCGAQSPGYRLLEAANQFRARGASVVTGSICDPAFGTILDDIARIVEPPSGLTLPTLPAADVVTVLRIAGQDGKIRKTCRGPAPVGTAGTALDDYDWWFTETTDEGPPTGASQYVFINHNTGQCEANPGETYSADYLGRIPAAGCRSEIECSNALGGRAADWTCFAGVAAGDVCLNPASTPSPGTCICGSVEKNCAAGRQ